MRQLDILPRKSQHAASEQVMTSREEQVLAARDPSVEDENEWEEFSLTDVKILIPGKSRYANLLTASPDNPVRVIGNLDEVEEEQASLVLDPDYLSKRIVIENVTHYAYGQHADGEIGIWVAGQAGWYSIVPAKGYRPMYNDMVEAIDLLYFLVDRHQRRRRKRRTWDPSFEYLCEEEEYERLKALHEPPAEEAANRSATTEAESVDRDAVAKAQADTIFNIITELKEAGALAKRQLNVDLVASTLHGRYEMDTEDYARALIAVRAEMLIEMMDQQKTSSFDWSRKAIYRELKSAAENNETRDVAITPLRPRAAMEDDDSSEHDSDHEDHPRVRRRRVRKSVLRPKLSSVSAKQAGKQAGKQARSSTTTQELEMSEDSEANEDLDTPSKSRGHELIREPPPSSASINGRARSILSDSDSTAIRKTPLQETLQSGNISNNNNNNSVAQHSQSALERTTNTENLPGDTWICSVQGCGKVVHKASSKRSKELIHDHTLMHADDTQTRLDLVFAEKRLNVNVGVEHLVNRIREIGALEGVTADGDTAAKRIRR
ncbi:hypothetical protein T310_7407 [Rasamsonia emersonii CBS 393.64]|uniref:DNA (cytosine-5)-methyltransferase 1 replication foci domain-containing protein n=1 Tax=Rasamsonia emersonii (strain ATCC 16479 / CBS 393.64 / IMI 116815) TaxID=1408163 RepID=A0A0F4YK51_RASE3|nr:hypothetical protein T310_7407 [Rasamsonia emersonii CBS 393.64]KKA18637.1 hypothetical protein T310_7407 [Rasamsonia emersonii CBS 393.64]